MDLPILSEFQVIVKIIRNIRLIVEITWHILLL